MNSEEQTITLAIPKVEDIICKHFKKKGNPLVTANIICGKTVTGKSYNPSAVVLSFDVRKTEFDGEEEYQTPIPVDMDDVIGMICEEFEETMNVTDVQPALSESDPTVFIGFKVTATEKKLDEKGKSI